MEQLGTNQVLVCSANYPDAVDDHEQIAEQLHRLATRAAERGMLISYEALAWSTYINTYEQAWDIVRTADHPALGMCIDSFHILSRGSDPAGIEDIPAEKLFFLQLADAPSMDMDLLQWSRHYRLFPGQGAFDLPAFLGHVLTAGLHRTAVARGVQRRIPAVGPRAGRGRRAPVAAGVARIHPRPAAPRAARERVPAAVAPPVPKLGGFAFAELAVDDDSSPAVAGALTSLGFVRAGQHRTKPVQLWEQGGARVLLNASIGIDEHPHGAAVAALGLETANPPDAAARAQALLAPLLPRRRGPAEADLSAVAAPDSTSVFFCRTGADDESSWLSDFPATTADGTAGNGRPQRRRLGGEAGSASPGSITSRSPNRSIGSTRPRLFYRAVLGLQTQHSSEIAAPFGLVRNRAVANADGSVRVCLSVSVLRRGSEWQPGVTDPQHVAFATDDIFAAARAAQAAGAPIVRVPANYYDDLDARLAPPPAQLSAMRELNVLLDRSADGEFLHFYTDVLGGRVFFEVVQRIGNYAGYGEVNSPVRMAAHRRQRTAATSSSA